MPTVIIVLVVMVVGFLIIEHSLRPTIRAIAAVEARWVATEAINQAIKDKIASVDYNQLVMVQTDAQGQIVLMQPNITRINQLAADTTLAIQNNLEGIVNEKYSIPLGQVLGTQLLADYGPRIPVSIYPIGTVKTNILNKFEEAGINQTRLQLYMDIEATMQVVVPLSNSQVAVQTEIPLTDTVIVGTVPPFYVNLYSKGPLSDGS
jgi:sporulation protein YunB